MSDQPTTFVGPVIASVAGIFRQFSLIKSRRRVAAYFYTCERCHKEFHKLNYPSLNAPVTCGNCCSKDSPVDPNERVLRDFTVHGGRIVRKMLGINGD